MADTQVHQQLVDFVLRHADTPDLQYGFLPSGLSESATASYLLLVASVNQGAKAETVGKFILQLWQERGPGLYGIATADAADVRRLIGTAKAVVGLSRSKPFDEVAVLRSAAQYLTSVGDLLLHARKSPSPAALVDEMAAQIVYFGRDQTGARKKAWMYMRWMVRPSPDLRLFAGLDPRDLEMPLDQNTCRAFGAIRRLLRSDPTLAQMECDNKVPRANAANRLLATAFARSLFPDDPIVMDYPLFLLGRSSKFQTAGKFEI